MSKKSILVAVALFGVLLGAVPAEAVVRASGEFRRVSPTSYELAVNNTGDQAIRMVGFVVASGVRVTSARTNGGDCETFETFVGDGEVDSSFTCDNFALDPGGRKVFGFRTNRTYPAGEGGVLYAYAVTGAGGYHRSVVAAPAGSPVVGRSELVRPVRGVVLVRPRGSERFVRLRRGRLLPDRSEIDTTRGTAHITVASDRRGGLDTATVSEGRAIIDQDRAARPTTTLRLSEPLHCGRLATASLGRKGRGIFVNTPGARIRTRGNRAAATRSGTAWRTTDTCATTKVKVVEGTVRVRDFRRRRTVNVSAPDSYTARGR